MSKYSRIPWQEIAAIGNIVVAQDNRMELEIIWDVVEYDLPQFIEFLNS